MNSKKLPSYEELKQRLDTAESALKAIHEGRMDAILDERDSLAVRLAKAEAQETHLKQVLLGIQKLNQLIIVEDDPQCLIQKACQTLVKSLGYFNAWIALLDEAGQKIEKIGMAEFNDNIPTGKALSSGFEAMKKLLSAGNFPTCMQQTLQSKKLVVVDDPPSDCPNCPLAQFHQKFKGLVYCLTHKGRIFGALSVFLPTSSVHGSVHGPEEHTLFIELANDIAFALYKIATMRELEEKRRLYQEIFENSRDGFVMVDITGKFLNANQAYCEMLGYTLEELRALPDFYSITPKRWQAWEKEEIWQKRLQGCGASGLYEKEYIRKNGEVFPVELRSYAIRRENGEIEYLWGTARDITERKQIEQALRESESYQRKILQATGDGFWVIDNTGHITEVNQAYCKMSGYSRKKILGLTIADLDAKETHGETAQRIKRIIQNGYEIFETIHRRKDSSTFPVEVSATYIEERGGEFVCFCRDLTERKNREARLNLLGHMLDEAPSSITIHDVEGRFLYANHKTLTLHGYQSLEEFRKINLHELDVPESEALLAERFRKIHEEGEAHFEVEHFRKDGSVFPLHVFAKSIEWEGGPAILSIANDISEQKDLQVQLLHAQKMQAIGRLAGGVAHDFNNMLTVIIGDTDMLLDDIETNHPFYDSIAEIRTASVRSAELTQQLLAFARKQIVDPKVIDLNKAVDNILKMLFRLVGENISMSWIPGKKVWPVKIDPSQLDQILANLCINARDSITGVGKITIETENVIFDEAYCKKHIGNAPGEYTMLALSDNGCGMDTETMSNIFEPFFTTKEMGKGTGLGLAMIYGIVKQNKGFINVYSELGQGTTFKIYLPRHSLEKPLLSEKKLDKPSEHGKCTILVVEDEQAILKMVTKILERHGYTVIATSSPEEAIHLANEHTGDIHLLISDVVMPKMNGRDLENNILSLYPKAKVLFMSGFTANVIAKHKVLGKEMNFLQKPFYPKDLLTKIQELLDTKKDENTP